jgi:hypothetical protein
MARSFSVCDSLPISNTVLWIIIPPSGASPRFVDFR